MREALVLCYHAVSERWPAALSVAPERLRQHLDLLRRRGLRGVSFSEAVSGSADKIVAITFDDAYRSVLTLGLPLLAEAGFPATVFAPTSYIGSETPMSWPGVERWESEGFGDELMPMSWEELAELQGHGWEIGSHTCSHPHLTTLDGPALKAQLGDSRAVIVDHLGGCETVAYPYGSYDAKVVDAARRAGYSAAATLPIGPKWNGDPLEFPRVGVYNVDTASRFRAKISPLVRRVRATSLWTRAKPGRLVDGQQPF